ncbi:unnamed protein product [Arctogadus glacialis]
MNFPFLSNVLGDFLCSSQEQLSGASARPIVSALPIACPPPLALLGPSHAHVSTNVLQEHQASPRVLGRWATGPQPGRPLCRDSAREKLSPVRVISFLKRLKPFIWTPAGWSGPSQVRGEGGHDSHKQMVSAISSSQVFLDRPAVKELFLHSSWKA